MSFSITFPGIPSFQSERLQMRLAREADRKAMLTLHRNNFENDYIKSAWGLPPHQVTEQLCDQFINKKIDMNELLCRVGFSIVNTIFFGIYKDEQLVGALEIYVTKEKNWEFGLFIDQKHKNLGFATEATKAFVEFAKQHTSIASFIFSCKTDNIASIKVAEKCGFVKFNTYPLYHGCQVDQFIFKK